ncbi:hypothetical protein [Acinetobacter lwoffii]|uniref:Uncharacterized protein n=1 Tax=Acinetobacter lwoffii NIPH 478 TaxID=1217668 RepID=N9HED7_ACILW|nr:hypothetical protein F923_01844 [Acinetobacter lwoffii NIPH 478]
MEKNWLVRTNQTITFLPMVIVIFIGLIGYEWVRTELVGSWILLIGFILLGRFLNAVQSVVLSIVIFITLFIYILFNVQADSMDINTRFLQLFILPVAPLLLSIYYEMMSTNQQTDNLLDTYRKNLTHKTLPISTYFYTQTQVQDMLNLNLISQYDEIYIEITNHSLLRDMLQVDELKLLQQKIIDVLESEFEVPHFSFTDSRLSVLRVIMIADRESTISKQLIEKIRQIELIKIEITHLPHHQGRPSLEERL